jgi:2-keto-4-pentenoate hydratase/2-oxohepta-3-ene-1,7-dioic acid hydratase in catechol pathway
MKLARLGDGARIFWASVDPERNTAREIGGTILDWGAGIAEGKPDLPFTGKTHPLAGLRFLPPIEPTSKIAAVGANYQKHLDELKIARPPQPVAFLKPYSALVGQDEEVRFPPITNQLDHEVELVAVMGAPDIEDRTRPSDSLLGYTIGNDVSARDLQRSPLGGMDLFSAKIHDRTAGLGPWIVTRDEFGKGPIDLAISMKIDGETRQSDRTSQMIWGVDELLIYVDDRTSLHTGDVVYTGTPAGVAMATGRYLEPGNVMEAIIERIGTLRNKVGPKPVRRN